MHNEALTGIFGDYFFGETLQTDCKLEVRAQKRWFLCTDYLFDISARIVIHIEIDIRELDGGNCGRRNAHVSEPAFHV